MVMFYHIQIRALLLLLCCNLMGLKPIIYHALAIYVHSHSSYMVFPPLLIYFMLLYEKDSIPLSQPNHKMLSKYKSKDLEKKLEL